MLDLEHIKATLILLAEVDTLTTQLEAQRAELNALKRATSHGTDCFCTECMR